MDPQHPQQPVDVHGKGDVVYKQVDHRQHPGQAGKTGFLGTVTNTSDIKVKVSTPAPDRAPGQRSAWTGRSTNLRAVEVGWGWRADPCTCGRGVKGVANVDY
eukprot:jgi/Botrbrau1/1125/Bobra.0162s0021.1